MARDDRDELIAVDQPAFLVDDDHGAAIQPAGCGRDQRHGFEADLGAMPLGKLAAETGEIVVDVRGCLGCEGPDE